MVQPKADTGSTGPFHGLRWRRVRATLLNVRACEQRKEHPLSIVNAIVKGVTTLVDGAFDNDRPHVLFHITERRFNRPGCALRQGDEVPIEVIIARRDAAYADRWKGALSAYLADPLTGRNFALAGAEEPEERSLAMLMYENAALPEHGEICLEFITPFPTGRKKGRDRTFLTEEDFVRALTSRVAKLFGAEPPHASAAAFSVLPYYWHYSEITHRAKSQPGVQYINGCAGRLYLKGDFTGIRQLILLGSELHAGGKLQNSQGYYIIRPDSPACLAEIFPSRSGVLSALRFVTDRYDYAAAELAGTEASGFDEAAFAERLIKELSSGEYAPEPSAAFTVRKKDGTDRIIERPSLRDLVAQRYLLKTVSGVFDKMFEETSIGYRKGVSRKTAIELVRSAAADGYEWVIESDVEDFFPSVDLAVLEETLDGLLPERDGLIKRLLIKAVRGGCVLAGEFRPREKGLPQGNPLSPMLANLYLDRFDERMMALGARLVRYADDFIIMTRTEDDARAMLERCERELSGLGLGVNREKTGIRRLKDGFEFLGIRFAHGEAVVESEDEFARRLKKPLYIVEPYVMLALSDDALEVRKGGAVVCAVPMRRLSEVMVMERAVFSTALVKRCAELKIPFSVALETGYCIATVRPDSKKHYEVTFRHTAKFAALSDTAHLAAAKEFASGKLRNYAAFFRQRHEPAGAGFAAELEREAGRILAACGLNEARGMEGAAAKKVYARLNDFIDDDAFRMTGRRREAPDRINSLLNFGYYLLFSRINATVRALGLNPYLGFLHSHADNYESLVCDIQELFRARVDRLILRVIGLGAVTGADFTESAKGFYLKRDGVKKFVDQFEGEMERRSRRNALFLNEAVYAQALSIRAWALDEGTLSFYEWKP